jgi:hypothetical protein
MLGKSYAAIATCRPSRDCSMPRTSSGRRWVALVIVCERGVFVVGEFLALGHGAFSSFVAL